MSMHTRFWWLVCVALVWFAPRTGSAQLAPTGSHYAARGSDTGFTGPDGAGGYSTSIPFDFPPARGGLPIPVQAATGGARYGALGVGWDVPLSFVYIDGSYAHRRPTPRKRVSVSLMGRTTEMVPVGGAWFGRTAADLKLITDGATYTLFDGNGLTYVFVKPSALTGTGGPAASDGLWLLSRIDGPSGSRVFLDYDIQSGKADANDPADSISINLTKVSYNRHPVDGCFKNDIELVYQARVAGAAPRSLSVLGDRILARYVRLEAIDVTARTDCGSTAQRLRRYTFGYEKPDADSGQDRLTRVTLTGRTISDQPAPTVPVATYSYGSASSGDDGSRVLSFASAGSVRIPDGAYPAINQAAAGADAAISFHSPIATAPNVAGTLQTLIDLTGDGRADLVFRDDKSAAPTYKLKIARNDPSAYGGFAAPQLLDGVPWQLLDARSFKYARFKQPADSLSNEENVWTQTIDVNGDGRLDIVDAASQPWTWVVYLNTPDSSAASGIKWERRAYDITKLYNHFHDGGWKDALEGGFLPLSRRITGRQYDRETCWVRTNGQWASVPELVRAPLIPGTSFKLPECDLPKETYDLTAHLPEQTYTEWSLEDMNGDGYPDFTFNSSPIVFRGAVQILRQPDNEKFTYGTERLTFGPRDSWNQVLTAYNVAGVFIRDTNPEDPFTTYLAVLSSQCGVGMWQADEATSTQGSVCGFADVNGDGIADRVTESGYVLLGTGMGFNTTRVSLRGRPWLAQQSTHRADCDTNGFDWAVARSNWAVRDVTGDGVADIVGRGGATAVSVTVGTGAGYTLAALGAPGVELSRVDERCDGRASRTAAGLFDFDGDGKADYIALNAAQTAFDVASITNGTSSLKAADAGRLISIGNGYGATTSITYRSAKADTTSKHQIAAPEIVVDSEQTTTLAKTLYAYGNIDTYFDSIQDGFRPTGYLRRVTLLAVEASKNTALVTVTDSHGLEPFSGTSLRHERFARYLRVGTTREVTELAGSFPDPWLLLAADISIDGRRRSVTQYDVRSADARLLQESNENTCYDMMFPYNYQQSAQYQSDYNPCVARGFLVTRRIFSWRGNAGPPSDANVQTATSIDPKDVDDYGRAHRVSYENDAVRPDDNYCVETDFAAPTGPSQVLFAPYARRVTNCGDKLTPVVYAEESFEYDKLFGGLVGGGQVTSHTLYRHDAAGAHLGTVREYDITYDANGNPQKIERLREDGATRTALLTYEPFALAPSRVEVSGTNVPTLTTKVNTDPLTNEVISSTDPNGTSRGSTYDGLGRVLTETFTAPTATSSRVVRAHSYFGFDGSTIRSVLLKRFPDPVDPLQVNVAEGRIATTYIDALGRQSYTDVSLGDDYNFQKLRVGERTYDALGRVLFEADPYPTTQSGATAYGTTRYFNTDGTLSTEIRGHGLQTLASVSAADERFPTVYQHSFSANQEKLTTQAPDSLTTGTAQQNVIYESTVTAIGRLISRSTWQNGVRIEHADFGQDVLGHQTSFRRYFTPASATNPVTWTWSYDSIGQLMSSSEPSVSLQRRKYSDWGELLSTSWAAAPPYGRHEITYAYDAYGRMLNSQESNDGIEDSTAKLQYEYDFARQSPFGAPTNVLGRLSVAYAPTSSTMFSYDSYGNVAARTHYDPTSQSYFDEAEYHADGSLASLTLKLPDNSYRAERMDYAYDSAGALRWMWFGDGVNTREVYNAHDVDVWGRTRTAVLGMTAYTASYGDTGRRLPQQVSLASFGAGRSITFSGFDSVGREQGRTENITGSNESYSQTYDALGRVKTAISNGRSWTFTYDALGNRTRSVSSGATEDVRASFKAADRDSACSFGYRSNPWSSCDVQQDNRGNVIAMPIPDFGTRDLDFYNSGNVKKISAWSTSATFRYDAMGEVSQLDILQGSSLLRSDRNFGPYITERTQNGPFGRSRYAARTFPGPGIAISRQGASGSWMYALSDSRGTRFAFNEFGGFLQDIRYTPFGEATLAGIGAGDPRFTSLQWNDGDGLDQLGVVRLGARIYDPVVGRFLSRDPLVLTGRATTSNPYSFASNDPINLSDPTGLCDPENCPNQLWVFSNGGPLTNGGSSDSNLTQNIVAGAFYGLGKLWTAIANRPASPQSPRVYPGGMNPLSDFGGDVISFARNRDIKRADRLIGFADNPIAPVEAMVDAARGGHWSQLISLMQNTEPVVQSLNGLRYSIATGHGLDALDHLFDFFDYVVDTKITIDGGIQDGGGPGRLPELEINAAEYPELAQNIEHAQRAGHPDVLTHGGNRVANRSAALQDVPQLRGLSRDEYPFASSQEGGAGAWVGHIPPVQQHAQGALVRNFLQRYNIQPGTRYRVVIKR